MTSRNAQKRQNALNALTIVAVTGAAACLIVAIIDISGGGKIGWFLLVLGFLPLLSALYMRGTMRKKTG